MKDGLVWAGTVSRKTRRGVRYAGGAIDHYGSPMPDETLCGLGLFVHNGAIASETLGVLDDTFHRSNPETVTCPDCKVWARSGATLRDRARTKNALWPS